MTYYPYLRGRLYDLLALKELITSQTLSPAIIPIIEPVRDSKQLVEVIKLFIDNQHPLALIANPQVGNYRLNTDRLHPTNQFDDSPWLMPSAILAADFSTDFLHHTAQQRNLLIANEYRFVQVFQSQLKSLQQTAFLSPAEARTAQLIPEPKIYLADHYSLRPHTADYRELSDEFFSSDHLYYQMDGYTGFSDYSILGAPYFEHGFPSRELALHLIYATANRELRIHHFVSPDNEQLSTQATKFQAVLSALVDFMTLLEPINNTPALQQLITIGKTKFPGLGTIKKLLLMHHFQLMGRLLTIN